MNRSIISEEIKHKWQEIVNLIAELFEVPAALIMKVEPSEISVLISSESDGNPYKSDERAPLDSGLYCETVMNKHELLIVPNALKDDEWKFNPDIELGMISYMGFPITWPEGEIFGTICVLDSKHHDHNELYQNILKQFRDVIEADLKILVAVEAHIENGIIKNGLKRKSEKSEKLLQESERSRKVALSMMEDLTAESTERKLAEDALKKSNEKHKMLLENAFDAIYLLLGKSYEYVNPSFCKITGYTAEELTSPEFDYNLILTEKTKEFIQQRHDIRKSGGEVPSQYEVEILNKSGEIHTVEVSVVTLGKTTDVNVFGIMRDITERKTAERELEIQKIYFEELFESAPEAIVILDNEDKIQKINREFTNLFGYTISEALGCKINDLIVPEDLKAEGLKATLDVATGKKIFVETIRQKKDGQIVDVSILGHPITVDGDQLAVYGIYRDISDRKREQEALEQSEYLLKESQRVTQIGSYRTDFVSGFWESSETLDTIFGINSEYNRTVEGWVQIVHPDHRVKMATYLNDNVIGKRKPFDYEYRIQRLSDGAIRWVHGLGECEFDEDGKILTMIGTIRDITEHKLTEDALRESEARHRNLVEKLPMVYARFDLKTNSYEYFNTLQTWHGMLLVDWNNMSDAERINLIHPDDYKTLIGNYEQWRFSNDNDSLELEYRIRNESKGWLWIECRFFKEFNADGEFVARYELSWDISKRKQAEENRNRLLQDLKLSETKFREVIENTNDAIYLLYQDKFVLTNKKFNTLLGVTSEETASPDFDLMNFIAPQSREAIAERGRMRERGEEPPSQYEFVALNGENEEIIVENSISIINYGDSTAVLGVLHDITERRRLTNQLQFEHDNLKIKVNEKTLELSQKVDELNEAILSLEEVNRHKNSFLSSMSHELRTPLNAIMGFNELLFGQYYGQLNEKQIDYVQKIANGSKHLLALISDLLDLAKIDAGKMDINLQNIAVDEFIDSAVVMVTIQAYKKKLNIDTVIDPNVRAVSVDRLRGKQILLNLLTNAIKFTPESGSITVRALSTDDAMVKFEIQDTGCGIESDELDKIFSEFHQADKVRDQQLGGTGIGLSICKRLVKMHSGEIGVESDFDKGSTFWFTLPSSDLSPTTTRIYYKSKIKPIISNYRILIVDDNPTNLTLLIDILSTRDYEIFTASNGKEAIELTRANNPDLILMDMKMPIMDGLDATIAIRKIPKFANLPIIALTARATVEDIEEQLVAGCTEHLSKPLEIRELLSIIAKHLENS